MEYDPNRLFDAISERLGLKSDALLSRALNMSPTLLSKIRLRALPIGGSMLMRLHEVSGLSVRELRDMMLDRRKQVRMIRPERSRSTREKKFVSPIHG